MRNVAYIIREYKCFSSLSAFIQYKKIFGTLALLLRNVNFKGQSALFETSVFKIKIQINTDTRSSFMKVGQIFLNLIITIKWDYYIRETTKIKKYT